MNKSKYYKDNDGKKIIIDLLNTLFKNKNLIIKITTLFFITGIIYSLSLKDIYKASSSFYPHVGKVENSNNIRNLAGLAGINLGAESSNDIPSTLYPRVINSPTFKSQILDKIIVINGEKITYKEYLLSSIFNSNSSISLKKILLYPIKFLKKFLKKEVKNNPEKDLLNIRKLSNDDFKLHNYLTSTIVLNLNEEEGFIELSVEDQNPIVASQIAITANDILQDNIIEFKIKNINDTYMFVSSQLEIAKANFYNLQDSLAIFKDNNRNIKSDLFLNQYSRIESEFNISKNIYNDLAISKEKIAIDVQKNTPIFTVIKPVVIPNEKHRPIRSNLVIIYTFFGLVLSCIYVISKSFIINFWREIVK